MAQYLQRKRDVTLLTHPELPTSIREKIFGFLSVSEVFSVCFCVSKNWQITQANWSTVHMPKGMDPKKIITILDRCISKAISKLKLSNNHNADEILYLIS